MATEQDHVWAMLDDMLVFLSKRHVPTPERTYKLDGGWTLAMDDLRRFVDNLTAERDQLRAELAAAKNEIDQVTSLYDECHEKFIAAEGEIARLNGECQRLDHDRDALAADNARLRKALKALREEVSDGCAEDAPVEELKPGIDFEVVLEVDAALAATPAQSLAAHDAALKVAVLREVAETCKFRLNGGEWRICPETLLAEADRMEQEAQRG